MHVWWWWWGGEEGWQRPHKGAHNVKLNVWAYPGSHERVQTAQAWLNTRGQTDMECTAPYTVYQ